MGADTEEPLEVCDPASSNEQWREPFTSKAEGEGLHLHLSLNLCRHAMSPACPHYARLNTYTRILRICLMKETTHLFIKLPTYKAVD